MTTSPLRHQSRRWTGRPSAIVAVLRDAASRSRLTFEGFREGVALAHALHVHARFPPPTLTESVKSTLKPLLQRPFER
jgi:hypothetical protein